MPNVVAIAAAVGRTDGGALQRRRPRARSKAVEKEADDTTTTTPTATGDGTTSHEIQAKNEKIKKLEHEVRHLTAAVAVAWEQVVAVEQRAGVPSGCVLCHVSKCVASKEK
mmetsp:Transcript_25275/g.59614  ORF Transcript_25275/g.59614 Transcript_25275/m.59614 type:complete len:111 (+) Transcript_25275:74-406(+)